MLDSAVIPQADRLDDVIRAIEAVANGARTYQQIAQAIDKVERQGRYYRLAGEQLGMISLAGKNHSELTQQGREFLSLPIDARQVFLANAALSNQALNLVFEFIEENPNSTRLDVSQYLISLNISESVANRRSSTILKWLSDLGLINNYGDYYRANFRPAFNGYAVELVEDEVDSVASNEQTSGPIKQKRESTLTYDLKELEEIWDGTISSVEEGTITYQIDLAARERASVSHQDLVTRIARLLSKKNITPMANRNIDLYAFSEGKKYIFEMKSCKDTNMISQVRKGISQLYEYKYRQNLAEASLWLVLETEPSGKNLWLIDYIVQDRGINICWSVDEDEFGCPNTCIKEFNELLL
ncbi:DUF7226 domain-containing protein [Alkalihalophilus marmarensis]|uniref:DUF7226 domain-containing protein n=1 Tax=Alkalihalophilus marmarensis TaxID=521377 RepID=UPI002DB9BE84|nr:hypothetical protein [Alkalihalophilus marmarensis]MEC2073996.1 hypothetical protein [Alkalihalophilus marmarensis]